MNSLSKWCVSCILLCILVGGCLAHAQDEEKEKKQKVVDTTLDYTYTKNDRIQVLSTSVITANRKSPTMYWLMCVDGYKYIAVTQNSGVAISQMFFDRDTPLMCTKQDRD